MTTADPAGVTGAPSELVERFVATVELDYATFTLTGDVENSWRDLDRLLDADEAPADDADALPGSGSELVGSAVQVGATLELTVPHQNNFAMPLAVERWTGSPPADRDLWQIVIDAVIPVTGEFGYESPTVGTHAFAVPIGTYEMRVCGAGFVGHGWPGSTTPGDFWRVQLWPTPDCALSRRPEVRKRWDGLVVDDWPRPDWAPPVADEPDGGEEPEPDDQEREAERVRQDAFAAKIRHLMDDCAKPRVSVVMSGRDALDFYEQLAESLDWIMAGGPNVTGEWWPGWIRDVLRDDIAEIRAVSPSAPAAARRHFDALGRLADTIEAELTRTEGNRHFE